MRDLEAFAALAQTQNFTRAAELCHLSQSAFSQKISRIEEAVGVRLFSRSTRQVMLTPEGESFSIEAARIYDDLRSALASVADLATLRTGRVSVAALPSVSSALLPGVFSEYVAEFPNVKLHLFDVLADECLTLLREGKVDLAVTSSSDRREFNVTPLLSEKFYFVCTAQHRLAAKRSVRFAELKHETFVHFSSNTSIRQHLFALNDEANVVVLEVAHMATVAAMVEAGLGISVVPALTLFQFSGRGLVARPVSDRALSREVVLLTRKGKPLSAAASAMAERLKKQAQRVAIESPVGFS